MGICLSNQITELNEVTLNSQHWRTVQDFFRRYGKMKSQEAIEWCQHHMNPNADWIDYYQYPYGSNQFVFSISNSLESFKVIIICKHQNKQKWKRIKYISIKNENNMEIITMIAYRQFWYLQNLIFNDEEDRAKLYYKCVFYFNLNSGLIQKIQFINLPKARGKNTIREQQTIVDISQARPKNQKYLEQQQKKKVILANKKLEQKKVIQNAGSATERLRPLYDQREYNKRIDQKYDNQRQQREADHRKAQERRDQERRQWQYEKRRY